MLKFFFYRSSPVVYFMNLLSCTGIVYLFWLKFQQGTGPALGFLSYFLFLSYFVFNFLNLFPWYPGQRGKVGIRLHFQKNLIPVVYLTPLALLLKFAGLSDWVLLPFLVVYLPMYYVAIILLQFHFRDPSQLTPGYFTQNLYLEEES